MISLKSTGKDTSSGLIFIEDDADLKPMTDEEFRNFEQEWNQTNYASPQPLGSTEHEFGARVSSIPFYRRHQMKTYIEQLERERKKR